jgi:hypothetical protein
VFGLINKFFCFWEARGPARDRGLFTGPARKKSPRAIINIEFSCFKENSPRLENSPLKTQNYTITYSSQDNSENKGFLRPGLFTARRKKKPAGRPETNTTLNVEKYRKILKGFKFK